MSRHHEFTKRQVFPFIRCYLSTMYCVHSVKQNRKLIITDCFELYMLQRKNYCLWSQIDHTYVRASTYVSISGLEKLTVASVVYIGKLDTHLCAFCCPQLPL